ncbi:hypothetical protein Taro_013817 [Colocasia esculenta]|uniref:Uncharacterized protein n=1 Tax=Colocasia esculenta TaxID=4460 RepID=A0A843UH83_COLES|nr:hypothetical protein [Colocasia esculenta]
MFIHLLIIPLPCHIAALAVVVAVAVAAAATAVTTSAASVILLVEQRILLLGEEGISLILKFTYIVLPSGTDPVHPRILHDDQFYPYFKDAIGAIDGTYIPTHVLKDR